MFADDERQVDLTLTVSPGPHVRVVFTGDSLPADRRTELVPVEREGSVDEDLLEDSSNRIEDYLRGQGYRDAKAPHTRQEMDGDLVVTFAVRKGPQYRVGRVDVTGNRVLSSGDLDMALRTREGNPYSQANLDADQSTIERLYRGRGFAGASVQVDSVPQAAPPGAGQVIVPVHITILEGVRTVVGAVGIEGNASIPDVRLRERIGMRPGDSYFDGQLRSDREAIQLYYADQGYQSATVDADAHFSTDRSQVNPVFVVREGPRLTVGHVLITGNVRTHAETIEREVLLKPGDPLSLSAEHESQRRLAALQLFRRAPQITELRHGDETTRDLLITVEEAAPTTIGYGAGVEGGLRVVGDATSTGVAEQKFELAPRAFVDLGRRNLFGKNRSVNLFASVSLYPSNSSTSSTVGYGFTQYQVRATFNEPRLLGTAADGLVSGTIEQQIRSSYNLARRSATAQVSRRLTRHIGASAAYQLQHTKLLDVSVDVSDQALIDRVFTQVRLSSFLVQGFYDTRDDPVDASSGEYFSANGQLAARGIGSEVGFAKSFFTAQAFRRLPHARGVVFAAQARLGVAVGFPRDVVSTDPLTGLPLAQTVSELPEAERFFAGGDTTVRGFSLDTIGRPDTIAANGFPIGGNAETIFNVELRVPVRGGVGVVGFVDAGNVFARTVDLNLGELRAAAGFGLRYKSPVGPLRVDLGFKINPEPGEGLTAWFISFGQAF
jgi:outer membrane protein assembly complex protein YaeT